MKRQIRLTESELHRLVENTVKNIIKESMTPYGSTDVFATGEYEIEISEIPELAQAFQKIGIDVEEENCIYPIIEVRGTYHPGEEQSYDSPGYSDDMELLHYEVIDVERDNGQYSPKEKQYLINILNDYLENIGEDDEFSEFLYTTLYDGLEEMGEYNQDSTEDDD